MKERERKKEERERKKEEEAKMQHDLEMLKGKLLLSLLENGTSPEDPHVADLLGGMNSIQTSRSRSFQELPTSLRSTFSQTPPPVRRQASFQATPTLRQTSSQASSQGSSVDVGQQSSSQVPLSTHRGASPQRPSIIRRPSSTETPHSPLPRQGATDGTSRRVSVHELLSSDDEILSSPNEPLTTADGLVNDGAIANDSVDNHGDVSDAKTIHNADI
ncbi:hypothetical protein F5H01DRAFT_68327 [Linnemannia elongata]|nr:hypothetical protein F5H01DRAFT_68327 [Linnemannia elongata]